MNKRSATGLLSKIETYPLAAASHPLQKAIVLMGDLAKGSKTFRMNRFAGLNYWKLVHESIDTETVEPRDRIMLGSLASISVERGQPFNPDARMQQWQSALPAIARIAVSSC